MLGRIFLVGGAISLSGALSATPLEQVLDVSVNIVVNQTSSELEIVAPETDFLVIYLPKIRRFQNLDIPFSVRSVDGSPHRYTLSLVQLTGQCTPAGEAGKTLSLTATLDGQSFTSTHSPTGIASPEQKHMLNLNFPEVSQTVVTQDCEGAVGLVAAETF